jgi:hypothetical protein
MYCAEGELCGTCFEEAEDQRLEGSARNGAAAMALVRGIGVAVVSGLLVTGTIELGGLSLEHLAAWLALISPALVVGLLFALQALRETRTQWLLHREEQAVLAVHLLGATLSVVGVGAVLFVSVVPLLR